VLGLLILCTLHIHSSVGTGTFTSHPNVCFSLNRRQNLPLPRAACPVPVRYLWLLYLPTISVYPIKSLPERGVAFPQPSASTYFPCVSVLAIPTSAHRSTVCNAVAWFRHQSSTNANHSWSIITHDSLCPRRRNDNESEQNFDPNEATTTRFY